MLKKMPEIAMKKAGSCRDLEDTRIPHEVWLILDEFGGWLHITLESLYTLGSLWVIVSLPHTTVFILWVIDCHLLIFDF